MTSAIGTWFATLGNLLLQPPRAAVKRQVSNGIFTAPELKPWFQAPVAAPSSHTSRREVKLLMPSAYMDQVKMWLRAHEAAFHPIYQPRWVNNIYFDTEEFASLFESVEGDSRRLKVRLRWYGDLECFNAAVLEFKCKIGQVGWKRSCSIDARFDLKADSWRDIVRRIRECAAPDHRVAFEQMCRPALINRYHREYYLSFDRTIRVTVDRHMRFWSQIAGMRPNLSRAKLFHDQAVIEFKAPADRAAVLSEAIHALAARCDKHSKYVTGMMGVVRVMH